MDQKILVGCRWFCCPSYRLYFRHPRLPAGTGSFRSQERLCEIAERYVRLIKEVAEQHQISEAGIEEETRQELLDEAKKSRENPKDFARRMAARYGLNFIE